MAVSKRGRATRDQLVRSAMEVFSDRGFRGSSLDKIAAAIGVTKQTLLYHFPSKDALLLAVLEEHARVDDEFAQRMVDRPDATLADVAIAITRRHHEEPGLAQLATILTAESVSPSHPAHDEFRSRYAELRTASAQWFERERQAGRLHPEADVERLAVALPALMDGLHVQGLLDPELDIAATLEYVLATFGVTTSSADPHGGAPRRPDAPAAGPSAS